MRLINLTPHRIVIQLPAPVAPLEEEELDPEWAAAQGHAQPSPDEIWLEPSGSVARVTTERTAAESVSPWPGVAIPTARHTYGRIEGLPRAHECAPECGYIVSSLVLDTVVAAGANNYPSNLFAPDTSPDSAVRDTDGRIVAVRALRRA